MEEFKFDLVQNWSFLPQELLEKIYESLFIADRIRSSLVCKTWLSIAAAMPQPPPEPWLISLGNLGHDYQPPENSPKFWSLSENKFYNFNNVTPQDCKIVGASNGWVLFERIGPKKPVFLVNPILNAEVKFPSLDYDQIGKVKKVLVVLKNSTARNDSDTPIGVIILGKTMPFYYNMAFITCEDPTWHYHRFGPHVHDIVLYNQILYFMITNRWATTYVFTCSLDEHLELKFLSYYHVEGIDFNGDRNSHRDRGLYLVECHGDLLVLKRKSSQANYGFEVFKLALDGAITRRGVKLRNLGDQALFLGSDGCLALPVRKGEGLFQGGTFEENHIYFNVDSESGSESGVYSLEFGTVKPISNLLSSWRWRTTAWFVPTTKETIVN